MITAAPSNTIAHPTGSQFELRTSEGWLRRDPKRESLLTKVFMSGVYVLRDDFQLGAIPPHPSEPLAPNTNVLDTKSIPQTAGTKLSLAILAPSRLPTPPRKHKALGPYEGTIREAVNESSDTNAGSFAHLASGNLKAFVFGGDNNGDQKDIKDVTKRKKPKSNITKSSSSFISRVIPHDVLAKRLQEHQPEGIYAFANVNRAMLWLDLSSQYKVHNHDAPGCRSTSLTESKDGAIEQDFIHQGSCSMP